MSRKDFERAAELIRLADPSDREALIATFVDFFQGENPRFDADRFRAACRPAVAVRKSCRVAA